MEKSDVTSMRKSKSHEGGIAELLNFKQKNKDMNEFIKVPMSEKLAYCFGDPALTLIYTITTTLLTYFYTNVVGISVGAVGMILLLSRVFDGFSDVLMGTIIDRTLLNIKIKRYFNVSNTSRMRHQLKYCCQIFIPKSFWKVNIISDV